MRIAITGGSGFIGTNLCEALLNEGHTIINIDCTPPRNPAQLAVWQNVDILNAGLLKTSLTEFEPDVLFHLAARTDLHGSTISDYSANVAGLENVLETSRDCKSIRRAVFASSRLVCRIGYTPKSDDDYCPTTAYGKSKVLGEQMIHQKARNMQYDWAIVRPTSIWGPWFRTPYRDFFDAIAAGRYVHPKGGSIYKSFGFVGNSVHQLICLGAGDRTLAGQTMYLADYTPIEVYDFARNIALSLGVRVPLQVPTYFLSLAARSGDLLAMLGWREVPITSFRLNNLTSTMIHDTSPLFAIVGATPHSTEDGIAKTVSWIRSESTEKVAKN